MLSRAIALSALCLLSGAGHAEYDSGGNILQREAEFKAAAAVNKVIRLPYNCDSACTELLSFPNICMTPGSSIGVHAANLNGFYSKYWTDYMWRKYARLPAFQARVARDQAMSSFLITVYSAETMHAYGVPYCQ